MFLKFFVVSSSSIFMSQGKFLGLEIELFDSFRRQLICSKETYIKNF